MRLSSRCSWKRFFYGPFHALHFSARYMTFVRIAAYHLQQLRAVQLEEKKEEVETNAPIKDQLSERLSADSGVGSPSAVPEESTQCEHDGDRIVKEIKVRHLSEFRCLTNQ
jgi:hypothetical protein